ncbi:hypothetical protein B0T16DRAFT_410400 [Cercophora newfieldiana]|uniref:Uncharacterized protein n=1 Tax=Cercophora newfieldiana TaxID=92897 RepID=A0AA40CS93_9PEZI|nr:hypothetical protein B0T16DRAFT_410400 [Cercophora newfieldiana]
MAGLDRGTKTGTGLPFPTDFTPPDDLGCPFTYLSSGATPTAVSSLWLGYSLDLGGAKHCYPSSFHENSGTFSPARCPQSWTTGSTYTLAGGVSGAVCCSSGYTHDGARSLAGNDNHDWCARVVPTSTIGILFESEFRQPIYSTFAPDPPKTALVRAVHVHWQRSDLPGLGLPPETSAPTGSNGPAAETQTPAAAGGGGLSDTAKAGIGAGVGVVAVAIIAAILLLLRRRRRRQADLQEKGEMAEEDASGDAGDRGQPPVGNALHAAVPAVAPVPAAAARGVQERPPEGGPRPDELQGPWSEYMARWTANQGDWAAYQAGAQHEVLDGEVDAAQLDDTHAGALPVDGRTPQDFARLEDTALAKPPGFASSDLEDFEALGDEKPRISEDSRLDSPLPRDEKN